MALYVAHPCVHVCECLLPVSVGYPAAQSNITEILDLFKATKKIELPVALVVDNPFGVPITVFGVEGKVYYPDLKTGIDAYVSPPPLPSLCKR